MRPAIVWFRQDLRLSDNPALSAAAATGAPILPLFVLDEDAPWPPGGAARWWLHHSLAALDKSLGHRLVLRRGDPARIVPALAREVGAAGVFWNRCYAPASAARDARLTETLENKGVAVTACDGALLHEPEALRTKSGTPFRVFTPFWKALRTQAVPPPRPAPRKPVFYRAAGDRLADWASLPVRPDWAAGFEWRPGEAAAHRALRAFLEDIAAYGHARDLPAVAGTSRLSPHLHWGEISPRQVWHAVRTRNTGAGAETFLKELGWREFCAQLLFHNPRLPDRPLDERFARLPWRPVSRDFTAWTRGRTGIPIVDAGMRQLWRTGWMHNRVRMIVASFLVKHLLIDWRKGEGWFWDCLVDADLANNSASWQWVAGCGADAAPFFRIFNPVLQGQKFDPAGVYVRRFVPGLGAVPDRFVHHPWDMPQPPAGYPVPIVDLAAGRARALAAFRALKR